MPTRANRIDRDASTLDRARRNFQRLAENWPARSAIVLATQATGTANAATSETAFDQTYTITPNTLMPGSLIEFFISGRTSGNAADTLLLRFYVGGSLGSSLLAWSAYVPPNGTSHFIIEGKLVVGTIGTAGLIRGGGALFPGGTTPQSITSAGSTINTTIANIVYATGIWSGAHNAILNSFVLKITP